MPIPASLHHRRCVIAVALGMVLAVAGAAAHADAPGKLPKTVIPLHYALDLRPDLDALLLAGSELIDIEVREPTDRLVLNAVNMTLGEAGLEDRPGDLAAVALDAAAETATLTFPRALGVGRHRLRIAFTAHINRFGTGLFALDYPTDAGRKRMLATHLEPTGARSSAPISSTTSYRRSRPGSRAAPPHANWSSSAPRRASLAARRWRA